MQAPRTANLNDLQSSYFSRSGNILSIVLAQGANATGPANAVPASNLAPDEAVGLVVAGRTLHQVTLSGTFSATVHFEGSVDGTNWYPLVPINGPSGVGTTPDMTAAGIYMFRGLLLHARINVTAYTSGSVDADLRSVLA